MPILFLLCCLISVTVFAQDSIVVSIDKGRVAQNTYLPLFSDFEKQTNIKIIRYVINDMKELDNGTHWQTADGRPIDVIKGHASERLRYYYNQGYLLDLSNLWKSNNWDHAFKTLKPLVTYNNAVLGLPYELNTWNIYYKKNVLEPYGVPPKNIEQLASLCTKLNKDNIIPFQILSKQPYTVMAWFEYILLRTHGLDFFNQLTKGEISYFDTRVTDILLHWKKLIDAQCFKNDLGDIDWQTSLPFFYRNKIAMLFMGSHIMANVLNPQTQKQLNLIPFPKIKPIPRYEAVPVDVYIVNKATQNVKAVEKFLNFIAQPKVQALLAKNHFSIPAHPRAKLNSKQYTTKLSNFINNAEGFTPFIDRALPPKFEVASRPYFLQFIKDGDIKHFQVGLESLRQAHYVIKTDN